MRPSLAVHSPPIAPFAKGGACAYCSCYDAPQRCEAMLADAREKQSARCRRTAPCPVAEWRAPLRRSAHSQPVAQARRGQIASATRVLRALAIGAEKTRQGGDTNEARVPKDSAKAKADAKADRTSLTGHKASARDASHQPYAHKVTHARFTRHLYNGKVRILAPVYSRSLKHQISADWIEATAPCHTPSEPRHAYGALIFFRRAALAVSRVSMPRLVKSRHVKRSEQRASR